MRNSGLICCALLFVILTACAAPAQTPENNVEQELADASGGALTEPKETDPSVQPEEMDESVESGEATSAGTEELSALLDTLISGATQKGGVWAAAIQRAGEETCISTDSGPMQSASLIKLFVAAAVEEHWAAVTAIESYSGETARLLFDMLSVSDNDATNHLVSRLGGGDAAAGMALVNQYCAAHGYADTSMGRLMLDRNADADNYTSVRDCCSFLQSLLAGEVQGGAEIMDALKQQTRTEKIPAGVPAGVETANKTGELDTVENDAAIIWAGESPYILCVMSEQLSDPAAARECIVDISQQIYQYFCC